MLLPRSLVSLLLVLLGALMVPAAHAEPALRPDPAQLGEGIVLADGWLFRGGDDPSWAAPGLDEQGWSPAPILLEPGVRLPGGWNGFGWFRLHLEIDPRLRNRPLTLGLWQAGASEIFLDGRPIVAAGRVGHSLDSEKTVRERLGVALVFNSAEHVLAIRHSNFRLARLQALGHTGGCQLWISEPRAVEPLDRLPSRELVAQVLFTGVPLVFCLLHLLFYVFDRRRPENLYFSLITVFFAALAFLDFQEETIRSLDRLIVLKRLMGVAFVGMTLSCVRFVYALVSERLPARFWRVVLIAIAVLIGWQIATPTWSAGLIVALFMLVVLIELVRALPTLWADPRGGVWLLGSGMLLFLTGGLLDGLIDLGFLEPDALGTDNPYLFGALALLFSMSIYLARSFARTSRALEQRLAQVEELSARTLEQEREAREHEIERRLLEQDNTRKTEELEAARRLQLSLLPREMPAVPGLDLAAAICTATEVGGDYYDFGPPEGGALTLAVGDAVGHGLHAGTLVAVTKGLFNALGGGEDLRETLARLDAALRRMRLERVHMALLLARFTARRLALVSAGMPPALVYRAGSGEVEELVVEGLPLGSRLQLPYRLLETTLAPGDVVLLMSDGLPELRADGQPLGYEAARELFRAACPGTAREVVERLMVIVDTYTAGQPPQDDVTLVVVRVGE